MAKKAGKKQSTKKRVGIVPYILLILLLAGGIVFYGYFSNWFSTDFAQFYVEINGEKIMQDTGGIFVGSDSATIVDVKYTFEKFDKDLKGYSLELSKSPYIDFSFSVGAEVVNFQKADIDVSRCFTIEQDDTSFSIRAKATSIVEMLRLAYPMDEISIDENTASKLAKYDLFMLTVNSADKSSSITLGLHIGNKIQSVTLDKTEIIF